MQVCGVIKNLNKIVVSDPNYNKNVWCRYDRTLEQIMDWKVKIIVQDYDELIDADDEDSRIKGLEYKIFLHRKDILATLKDDLVFAPKGITFTNTEIGVDSAQLAFGINEKAAEINKHSKHINNNRLDVMQMLQDYNPYFAIQTGSDGCFGSVKEGKKKDELQIILIDGFLDEYASIESKEDLMNYFIDRFNVTGIERTKEEQFEIEFE